MTKRTDGWIRPARLKLVVLQPTPFCNIDCSYCYLAHRKSTSRMTLETLNQTCRRIFESPNLDQQLEIAWHGGEPLAVPLPWYEEAIALIEELRPAGLHITHCFQTNGLLLNDDWIDFLVRIGAKIGLSIDGPADLHDANRRTRSGNGTHQRAMRAVALLQDRGLPFHVITVLTERALDDPDRLFEFYVDNGIKEVGFNVEEIEGANVNSSLAGREMESKFRRFINHFFERVWNAPHQVELRELENTIEMLLSKAQIADEQNVPLSIISVSHDGAISTFSPELLGARDARFGDFTFGRVGTHSLFDVEQSAEFQLVKNEIQRGVSACERTCPYFRWCGGGAPANKLFETGRFDATETLHCRLTRKVVLDEVIAGLEARIRPAKVQAA
jgi:uncharacterized protein